MISPQLQENIKSVISQSILYISSLQQENGSFVSYSSPDKHDFSHDIPYTTTFLNSQILSYLSQIPESKHICERLNQFIVSEKNNQWSWNYWSRLSPEYTSHPYPDDMDDTACAISALTLYNKKLITGEALSNIVQLLIRQEHIPGGPYRTWIVPSSADDIWKDIDIVVNCNIAYMLSLHGVYLESLERYIDINITKKTLTSPYYPDTISIIYFILRWYKGTESFILKIAQVLNEIEGTEQAHTSPLSTAYLLLSHIQLESDHVKLLAYVDKLLHEFNTIGWSAHAYCIDPSKENTTYYAGSSAFTAALCSYALQSFIEHENQALAKKNGTMQLDTYARLHKEITNKAIHISPLTKQHSSIIRNVCQSVPLYEVTLLPYYFFEALHPSLQQKISLQKIKNVCVANLLGWTAHSLLDDIRDERKNTDLQDVASTCMTHVSTIYQDLLSSIKKEHIFHTFIKDMNRANDVESLDHRVVCQGSVLHIDSNILNQSSSDYRLFEKSSGHALGPLTILLLSGQTDMSESYCMVKEMLTHYIIAKQLNDDAHDWLDDMKKGIKTDVVIEVLLKFINQSNNRTFPIQIDIEVKQRKLELLFWKDVLPNICSRIQSHCDKSFSFLHTLISLRNITYPDKITQVLSQPQAAANNAREESKKTLEFLGHYNNQCN